MGELVDANVTANAIATDILLIMLVLIWTPPGLARDISCLVKLKSAAVLYPALLQTVFKSAGPDGIRQERPHLLIVL